MGIDVRFYYASLIAVFIFFLIGLLIGIGLTRQPAVENLAAHIEEQLRRYRDEVNRELARRDEQIRILRAELKNLEKQLGQQEQFVRNAAPILVHQQLSYRNVAIIITAPDEQIPFLDSLKQVLRAADANVRSCTRVLSAAYEMNGSRLIKLMATLQMDAEPSIPPAGDSDALRRKMLVTRLATLVKGGDTNGQLQHFERAKWVKLSGDYSTPIGAVVLIGAVKRERKSEHIEGVDVWLIRAFKALGARIVACEATEAITSVMSTYQREKVPTVDNLDSTIGQISAVLALARQEGHYGWKTTAQAPFPKLELSAQTSSSASTAEAQ